MPRPKTPMPPLPCMCGSETSLTSRVPFSVLCRLCGARGPRAKTHGQAKVMWALQTGRHYDGTVDAVCAAMSKLGMLPPRARVGYTALAEYLGITLYALQQFDYGDVPLHGRHGKMLELMVRAQKRVPKPKLVISGGKVGVGSETVPPG